MIEGTDLSGIRNTDTSHLFGDTTSKMLYNSNTWKFGINVLKIMSES